MMRRNLGAPAVVLMAVVWLAGPAAAAVRLVSSTPAGHATVAPLRRIQLHFNDPLAAKSPSATLVSTRMMMGSQMMSHLMPVDGAKAAVDPNDPKSIVVTLPALLGVGDYRLTWKAATTRAEALLGDLTFSVK